MALVFDELPSLDRPPLVVSFSGWPDAAEVGSGAVAYLIRTLEATRFASIDPEPFYVFGESRPSTLVLEGVERALSWPASEFFAARDSGGRDMVLFLAREPNLRWRAYLDLLLGLAERLGAGPVVSLGGTYDRVSHRGPPSVSGWSPTAELRQQMARMGLQFTGYQGPSSIHSALMEACRERGTAAASLWGHAPHYVSGVANPKVANALLEHLAALLGLELELGALGSAARELEAQIEQALLGRSDLSDYVRGISAAASNPRAEPAPEGVPSAESIVEDLEAFLRQLREDDEDV